MPRPSPPRAPRPLDAAALDALAVRYLARYATTRGKLAVYLERKLAERGWEGAAPAPVAAVVERMADLGYVDDGAFAAQRGAALTRRGYGARRVSEALRAAGIAPDDAADARDAAAGEGWAAALAFARRRRIGPFAATAADPDGRRRALGAMLRAGHAPGIARRILAAEPGAMPEEEP